MKKMLLLLLIGMLLVGCKTRERVVEKIVYRDSVVTHTEYLRDSVYINDSTIVREKGDTILIEKWKVIYKDRYNTKSDTIYIDKVKTEKEVQTITKKVVPKWCWWLLVVVCGYVVYRVIRWRIKL